jgi:hypothetical protein
MPRRRPDVVHEYRISLSDFERKKIEQASAIAAANVGLDAVTDVLKAAGTALGGGGALLAAYVLMKWKAPNIVPEILEKTNGALDTVFDTLVPGTPAEDRRRAQDFAARRAELAKKEATYCEFSSESYDEQQCSLVQQEKDQYFIELKAFQNDLRQRYGPGDRAIIYSGLGDINPDFVDGGNTTTFDDYVKAGWLGVWKAIIPGAR